MTDTFCYCIECNKETGKSVESGVTKMVIVNGMCVCHLDCGHKVIERFVF